MTKSGIKLRILNWSSKKGNNFDFNKMPSIAAFYPIDKNKTETEIFEVSNQPIAINLNLTLFNIRKNEPIWIEIDLKNTNRKNSKKSHIEGWLNDLNLNPKNKMTRDSYVEKFEIKFTDLKAIEGKYIVKIKLKDQEKNLFQEKETYFILKKEENRNEKEN